MSPGSAAHVRAVSLHALGLLGSLASALAAFERSKDELGVSGQVTTFTESEFARTFEPNARVGTDHAWGGHHLVLGGAVRGVTRRERPPGAQPLLKGSWTWAPA